MRPGLALIAMFVGEHSNPSAGSNNGWQDNESKDFNAAHDGKPLSARRPAKCNATAAESQQKAPIAKVNVAATVPVAE
jgi:hypothetical protein